MTALSIYNMQYAEHLRDRMEAARSKLSIVEPVNDRLRSVLERVVLRDDDRALLETELRM